MKSQDLTNGKNHAGKESNVRPADIIWVKNRGGSWWPAQVVDENLISENRRPSKRSAGKVLVRLYGTYTYSYVDPIKWRSEFDTILEQNNGSYREIFSKALEQDVACLRSGGSKRQRSKSKDTKDDKSRQPKKENADEKKKSNGRITKHGKQEGPKKNLERNNASSATKGEKRKNKQDDVQKKCEPNGRSTDKADGNLTPEHDELLKKRKLNNSSPETCTKSQELSARRLRVMQSLGLAAPPGSPFCKKGRLT